jgi:hypothetical protein
MVEASRPIVEILRRKTRTLRDLVALTATAWLVEGGTLIDGEFQN